MSARIWEIRVSDDVRWINICISNAVRLPDRKKAKASSTLSGGENKTRKASLIFILRTGNRECAINSSKFAAVKNRSSLGKVRSISAHWNLGETLLKIPNALSSISATVAVLKWSE
jgi:hypothetical protein